MVVEVRVLLEEAPLELRDKRNRRSIQRLMAVMRVEAVVMHLDAVLLNLLDCLTLLAGSVCSCISRGLGRQANFLINLPFCYRIPDQLTLNAFR